jgi:hypothetical protein
MTRQLVNLAVEIANASSCLTAAISSGRFSINSSARTAKTLNLARQMTRPRFLKKATDLVFEIALDLHQQRPARQQCLDRVAVEVLDAHLLKPAGLHDAGYADRIIAVALIDLHLEHRLSVARVDADHRQRSPPTIRPCSMLRYRNA